MNTTWIDRTQHHRNQQANTGIPTFLMRFSLTGVATSASSVVADSFVHLLTLLTLFFLTDKSEFMLYGRNVGDIELTCINRGTDARDLRERVEGAPKDPKGVMLLMKAACLPINALVAV